MSFEKTGVYAIRCEANGKVYVGSSVQIYRRWNQHRVALRRGTSNCLYLQRAWAKYGEGAFSFHVVEECAKDDLEKREQHYIDSWLPQLNVLTDVAARLGPDMLARRAATLRARAALITHCPKGHEYSPENTYFNKRSKRICRACNAARVSKIYASETPEQRAKRLENQKRVSAKPEHIAARAAYAAAHKAEKAAYDREYRKRR